MYSSVLMYVLDCIIVLYKKRDCSAIDTNQRRFNDLKRARQGVTKRCRLSWLTNSALVYEPKCGGREGESCRVSANEYSCTQESK
jgi:hypothetical protein